MLGKIIGCAVTKSSNNRELVFLQRRDSYKFIYIPTMKYVCKNFVQQSIQF